MRKIILLSTLFCALSSSTFAEINVISTDKAKSKIAKDYPDAHKYIQWARGILDGAKFKDPGSAAAKIVVGMATLKKGENDEGAFVCIRKYSPTGTGDKALARISTKVDRIGIVENDTDKATYNSDKFQKLDIGHEFTMTARDKEFVGRVAVKEGGGADKVICFLRWEVGATYSE
jgi:hypothetical protein